MRVGIEAVSRGAKKAILCDSSKKAIEIIKRNVEKTHTNNEIEVYETTYEELLKNKIKEIPTITFIDPPYDTDLAYNSIQIMEQEKLINEKSIIIIETDQEKRVKEQIKKINLEITDTRKYGRAYLIFLSQKRKG